MWESEKLKLPASVRRCGFCGNKVKWRDTLLVSLSYDTRVDGKRIDRDTVGCGIPCCPKCFFALRWNFIKAILIIVFVVASAIGLCVLIDRLAGGVWCLGWSVALFAIGGIALYVSFQVALAFMHGTAIVKKLDIPWFTELYAEKGYKFDLMFPRHAYLGDAEEEHGERSVWEGRNREVFQYYTWKGFVDCYHENLTAVPQENKMPVLKAIVCYSIYAGGFAIIWGGGLLLTGWLLHKMKAYDVVAVGFIVVLAFVVAIVLSLVYNLLFRFFWNRHK